MAHTLPIYGVSSWRARQNTVFREAFVVLSIGVILLIAWVLAFLLLKKVVGAAIHLLLIFAVIAIAWHFIGPLLGR